MNEQFSEKTKAVQDSYYKRVGKLEKVWQGFQEEIDGLTSVVSEEFKKVLDKVDMEKSSNPVKINSFETAYEPQHNYFKIEIRDWVSIRNGQEIKGGKPRGPCAYGCLEPIIGFGDEVHPEIKKFQEDYNVLQIHTSCECGSDHK